MMEDGMPDKLLVLWRLSRSDPKCQEIGRRYDALETAFGEMAAKLSREDQDIAWGFVCTSDELDGRLMELMCEWFDLDPVGYLEKMNKRGME